MTLVDRRGWSIMEDLGSGCLQDLYKQWSKWWPVCLVQSAVECLWSPHNHQQPVESTQQQQFNDKTYYMKRASNVCICLNYAPKVNSHLKQIMCYTQTCTRVLMKLLSSVSLTSVVHVVSFLLSLASVWAGPVARETLYTHTLNTLYFIFKLCVFIYHWNYETFSFANSIHREPLRIWSESQSDTQLWTPEDLKTYRARVKRLENYSGVQ